MMEKAYTLFTSKSALIRHLLKQVPPEEFPPNGPLLLEKANELKSKLPQDIQDSLGPITLKDVCNGISNFRKSQKAQNNAGQPEASTKIRVMWSENEINQVVTLTANLLLSRPQESLLVLCNQAQEQVLPEHRRRKLNQAKQAPQVFELINQRLLTLKEHAQLWDEYSKQPPPEPQQPEAAIPSKEEVLSSFSNEALAYYLLNERQAPLSLLLPNLVERLAGLLEKQPEEQSQLPKVLAMIEEQEHKLDMLLDHLTRSNKPAPTPSAPPNNGGSKSNGGKKLPKFAVCGLWPNKFHELQRACKNHVELRYIERDMNCPNFSSNDAYTILFVEYMSHDTNKQAVDICGKDKVIVHRGGVSTAVDMIINLAKTLT